MGVDRFPRRIYDGPLEDAAAVIPSDSTDLTSTTRGLYIGTSGDVKIRTKAGTDVIFKALAAGVIHPVKAVRVFSTGTTATDIVACY